MVTNAGWLFHYTDGTPLAARHRPGVRRADHVPAQRGRRAVRPRHRRRSTTRSCSRRRRVELEPRRRAPPGRDAGCRRCSRSVRSRSCKGCALIVSFTRHAQGAGRSCSRKRGAAHVVARTTRRDARSRAAHLQAAALAQALADRLASDHGARRSTSRQLRRRADERRPSSLRRRGGDAAPAWLVAPPLLRRGACDRARRRGARAGRRPARSVAQPLLGAADAETVLMGAARGEPDETWGYRVLPLSVGRAIAGGRRRSSFGPPPSRSDPAAAAFLRHTRRHRLAGRARRRSTSRAAAYRGPVPEPRSARVTPTRRRRCCRPRPGTGRSTPRSCSSRRDPGGALPAAPPPPPGRAAARRRRASPPRRSAGEPSGGGRGRASPPSTSGDAHRRSSSRRSAAPSRTRSLHYDGERWTREPVERPGRLGRRLPDPRARRRRRRQRVGCSARGRPRARRAAIVLLEREAAGRAAVGRARPRRDAVRAARHARAGHRRASAPLGGAGAAAHRHRDGVWIDGALDGRRRRARLHALLRRRRRRHVDRLVVRRRRSATRAAAARASRAGVGYRSFAWAGAGFGDADRHEPARRRAATTEDEPRHLPAPRRATTFVRMPGGGGNFRPSGAFALRRRGLARGAGADLRGQPRPSACARGRSRCARRSPTSAAAAGQPRRARSDAQALAAGLDGGVARYLPGAGWTREFLLSSSGAVNKRAAARRRLARAGARPRGRRPRRDVACGARRPACGSATPARRSASRAT